MLEINAVNKYFHKGRKNQIHVINNTTLQLEDKGLVALLGPSGCGKTTLLNAIGGLDKIKSGSISINNQKISTRKISRVDKLRNSNIGYIFQDYKLIEHLSVYDNVAIVLKMKGIKDKSEIKEKVEYVLEKVGMLRYKKRPANMLSGGERQRVGIARAIVKSPNIILADEPTGNLDSKNTLEIMKIIKSISQERLVILVTHEQDLAKFYASRIIEIEDGRIVKDYENELNSELDYRQDSDFYLKDFSNHLYLEPSPIPEDSSQKQSSNFENNHVDIQVFSNQEVDLQLTIVIKNGNIYLKSENSTTKIEVVDENSSIEFIDDHYQKLEKQQAFNYQFDFDKLSCNTKKKNYASIFNLGTLIKNGFKRVIDFPILKKVLLAGFFLSAMFIMYSVSSIAATLTIDEQDFVDVNKSYISIQQGKVSVENYLQYEQLENINDILPGNSKITLSISLEKYYQTQNRKANITGSLTNLNQITEKDIVLGKMPETATEIAIDKMTLERALNDNDLFQMVGIMEVEDFLNKTIPVQYMDPFTIVGITDTSNPSIYIPSNSMINVIANNTQKAEDYYYGYYQEESSTEEIILDYNLYQNKINLTKGRFPINDYEVIVSTSNAEQMPLNKEINLKINDKKLTVVGYYDSSEGYSYYFVNPTMIKYQVINSSKTITVSTQNKAVVLEKLQDEKLNAKDCYEESRKDYLQQRKEDIKVTLSVSGIILLISLIEIFLMIRSSFLSRIKEIGIFRAIGVKRIDIYKMFAGEIIAITTLASVPGLLLMAYILSILSKIKYLTNYIMITPSLIIASFIFVYLFNLIIGLFPVYNTIRKRPAEILSRYDLD